MQVMEGGENDLHDIIEQTGAAGLPHNQCRYVFQTMAESVQQMHLIDLVHHDLKPKNFVRWFDGRFRLVDFDSTREAGRQDMGQTVSEVIRGGPGKYCNKGCDCCSGFPRACVRCLLSCQSAMGRVPNSPRQVPQSTGRLSHVRG